MSFLDRKLFRYLLTKIENHYAYSDDPLAHQIVDCVLFLREVIG